jgi:tRNA 2-thiocytidine biosynthesis protein TtcA
VSAFPHLSPRATQRLNVFVKKVGRGINRFAMLQPGDRVLIGVSGGKDSLALCVALSERVRWVPMRYECRALIIDWLERPAAAADLERVRAFLERLEIPCDVVSTSFYAMSRDKPFNCYICARNRKRILFREAERRGISKIALGHQRDDIIETTLMNLFYRGEFSTMMPVQRFFGGRMQIIRPMCEVGERDVERLSRVVDLPVFSVDCPRNNRNHRLVFKEIIRKMERLNRHVRENIYNAPWRINPEYLPTALGLSASAAPLRSAEPATPWTPPPPVPPLAPPSLPRPSDPDYIRGA